MSICIEGMRMPEDGIYTLCITHDSSGKVHWVFQNEDTYEFLKHGRVKELPPHGDLIDRDKLEKELVFDYAYAAAEICRNAPTIIPASKEGEK